MLFSLQQFEFFSSFGFMLLHWDEIFLSIRNLQICFSPELATIKSQLLIDFFQFLDCLGITFIYFSFFS